MSRPNSQHQVIVGLRGRVGERVPSEGHENEGMLRKRQVGGRASLEEQKKNFRKARGGGRGTFTK